MPAVQNIRRLCRLAALLTASTVCLAAASTGAAAAATLPPQGVFENCQLDTQMALCVQRLGLMHQGGLQVVVIPAWSGSPASLTAYAASARSLGMSVMWELSDPGWWQDGATGTQMLTSNFSSYVATCGCTDNSQLLSYVVHFLSSLPGTYGYYAADDSMLSPGDQTGVSAYVSAIKQVDPSRMVMVGAADESQAGQYQHMADAIGTEIYPVTTNSLMPMAAGDNQDMWDSVAQTAIDAQNAANNAGKQSAFILQAFTWGDNVDDGQAIGVCSPSDTKFSCYAKLRYPSAADQLQLRNEVLLHAHPKLILWWSFPGTAGQAGNDTYSIYPTGAEAWNRWVGLVKAVTAPFPTTQNAKRVARAHIARAVKHTARHHKRHRKHRRHHRRHRHHHHRRHRHRVA